MNAGKLVSWDANGTFLPIKQVKEGDLKSAPQPRQKIVDAKTIYDQDSIFDLDEEGNPKKQKTLEVIKDKVPVIPKTENYYQPNPLTSHDIQQGVTMEYYGHKKTGGKYDVGGGRLTMDQYHQLLEQLKPYSNAQIEERHDEYIEGEEKEKIEGKNEGQEGQDKNKDKTDLKSPGKKLGISGSKKLYFLFREDIMKVEQEKQKKKNQENIIKKKKKKAEEKKAKAVIDKIELKDFNFQEIKNTQDKTIYNELKENVEENYVDFYSEKKTFMKMPTELHTREEKSTRTREKRSVQIEPNTINQLLPNTIKRTLTKIKEESEQIEQNIKNKVILPPLNQRPKSNYITNKNKNKNKKKPVENETNNKK